MTHDIPELPSDGPISRFRVLLDGDGKGPVSLSRKDAKWLLAEIDGGREAFAALVDANALLRREIAQSRENHRVALDVIARLRRGERIG